MRRFAEGPPELAAEVRPRQAGRGGEIVDGERLGVTGVGEVLRPQEVPRGRMEDQGTRGRAGGRHGASVAARRRHASTGTPIPSGTMTLAGYDHLLAAGRRLQWDDAQVDLGPDADAWPALDPALTARVTALVAGFCVAEVAVATHLEPFGPAAGDPSAAACFALQAQDERRHARFFARVAREVLGVDPVAGVRDLAAPGVVTLFEADLPALAARLAAGDAELAEAVGLYHLVLEGIVFGIGQEALLETLTAADVLPGLRAGLTRVQADERWHVGLGVMCLQDAGGVAGAGDVAALAARAAAAWGADVATPGRVDRALAVHARRLAVLTRAAVVAR